MDRDSDWRVQESSAKRNFKKKISNRTVVYRSRAMQKKLYKNE